MVRALTRKRWAGDVTPWREFDLLSDRMREMMEPGFPEAFFRGPAWAGLEEWAPAVELVEKDGEYVLTAEVPGIPKADIDVAIDDNVLTLKGEKKTEFEKDEGRAHIRERRYGSFERSFTLPRNVDASKVRAEFRDGIVQVHLPKGEAKKARHIEIK